MTFYILKTLILTLVGIAVASGVSFFSGDFTGAIPHNSPGVLKFILQPAPPTASFSIAGATGLATFLSQVYTSIYCLPLEGDYVFFATHYPRTYLAYMISLPYLSTPDICSAVNTSTSLTGSIFTGMYAVILGSLGNTYLFTGAISIIPLIVLIRYGTTTAFTVVIPHLCA